MDLMIKIISPSKQLRQKDKLASAQHLLFNDYYSIYETWYHGLPFFKTSSEYKLLTPSDNNLNGRFMRKKKLLIVEINCINVLRLMMAFVTMQF